MNLSRREAVLLLATVGSAMIGGTWFAVRPQFAEWSALRTRQVAIRDAIDRDQRMFEQKARWQAEFDELKDSLPMVPLGQKVDVYWLSIVDRVAERHGLKIIRRQVNEERPMGDVYEMPIEAKDWEGTLDSLVRFMVDLRAQGAMLDMRQLLVRPRGQGVLRGRFLLHCVYRREKP